MMTAQEALEITQQFSLYDTIKAAASDGRRTVNLFGDEETAEQLQSKGYKVSPVFENQKGAQYLKVQW